jgi:hypothetical protein
MKPNINSVEVHNGHPMDGALVGAGSLWPQCCFVFLGGRATIGIVSNLRHGKHKLHKVPLV